MLAGSAQKTLSIEEINQLDDCLMSLYSDIDSSSNAQDDEHIFSVSMLDGYLTAVLLAPYFISDKDWLSGVWCEKRRPVFKDGHHKWEVTYSIHAYYQMLKVQFDNELTRFDPLVYYTLSDKDALPQIDLWLDGFERGFEYFERYWLMNPQIEAVVDQILSFDDYFQYDNLALEQRNQVLPKLADLVVQLHALNKSNPEI